MRFSLNGITDFLKRKSKMIEETKGDLLKSQTEALVNTVNTVGVMGKGVALQFRQAFS